MTSEDKLKKRMEQIERQLEVEQIKNGTLNSENKALKKSLKVGDNGNAYILYLQSSLAIMERIHEDQDKVIDKYRKHFARFKVVYSKKI